MDKLKSQELLTNEVTQRYIDMINAGIAKFINKTGNSNLYGEFNDWFQDCFMELIEFINREKRLPKDSELWLIIKYVCIDNVRYGERRNHSDYDELEHDHSDWAIDGYLKDKPGAETALNLLLNKFKPGTKERKFIEWYLERFDFRDFGYHPPVYTGAKDKGYSDSYLATEVLGFPGTGSSAYKTFKRKMMDIIKKELSED